MQKLGYIISDTKLRGIADFIEVSADPSFFNRNEPAIIVGLQKAKKQIDNFSILEKNPSKNKFWTYGKTERRNDFDKDIQKFYDYVINQKISSIKYFYVNIFKLSLNKIKSLLSLLYSNDPKYFYIYKDMIYLYHRDYILGISLKMLKYSGININKHLNKLYNIKTIKVYYSESRLDLSLRKYAKNKKYLIPYFLSLSE